jgi:hypothetical protein
VVQSVSRLTVQSVLSTRTRKEESFL